MNRKIFWGISGLIIVFVIISGIAFFGFNTSEKTQTSEQIAEMSYNDAVKANKPFILMFTSDWCSYCLAFEPRYEFLSEVYKDKLNFIKVNADDNNNFNVARDFSLSGVPALYIVDPEMDNRIYLSNGVYGDLGKLRKEIDRFLRIRAMIKK